MALRFAAWLFPGDVLESAGVSITSSDFGGTDHFDGNVNFSQAGCAAKRLGFNVCDEFASLTLNLNADTYWLNLQSSSSIHGSERRR